MALLVVVMALIEVVLLAGPAFAVGARRQARNLALMAATGGTPRQARRVVLAGAVVLGSVGAALGTVLGIGVGLGGAADRAAVLRHLARPVRRTVAAPRRHRRVRPAQRAAGRRRTRVDRVAPGRRRRARRPARRPRARPAFADPRDWCCWGSASPALSPARPAPASSRSPSRRSPAVLGMILLVPIVVVGVARLARRLPLSMRYAVRDAARHRTRTVPAVAAVAATVAGVVALGIANSSDAAQNEATYQPQLPAGDGVITSYDADAAVLTSAAEIVDREIPDATVTPVRGIVEGRPTGESAYLEFRVPGAGTDGLLDEYALPYGSSVLVSDGAWPAVLGFVADADEPRARAAIAAGDVVVFSRRPVDQREVKITGCRNSDGEGNDRPDPSRDGAGDVRRGRRARPSSSACCPRRVARDLEVPVAATALSVTGADITAAQERTSSEALAGAVDRHDASTSSAATRPTTRRCILLARAGRAGCAADARRHADRDVPRAVRRPPRPRDPGGGGRLAPDPPRRRLVVRPRGGAGRGAPRRGGRVHPRHRGELPADRAATPTTPVPSSSPTSTSRG